MRDLSKVFVVLRPKDCCLSSLMAFTIMLLTACVRCNQHFLWIWKIFYANQVNVWAFVMLAKIYLTDPNTLLLKSLVLILCRRSPFRKKVPLSRWIEQNGWLISHLLWDKRKRYFQTIWKSFENSVFVTESICSIRENINKSRCFCVQYCSYRTWFPWAADNFQDHSSNE